MVVGFDGEVGFEVEDKEEDEEIGARVWFDLRLGGKILCPPTLYSISNLLNGFILDKFVGSSMYSC